jgi:DNA-binding HxlR family transcriptional regulator
VTRRPGAAAERTARVLSHKWNPTIISLLASGGQRFSKLRSTLPEVSHKVLIEHLRRLERDGIVSRQAKVGSYRRVHYSLTESGLALLPIIELMVWWGSTHGHRAVPSATSRRLPL